MTSDLLTARVESEAAKSQAVRVRPLAVIPGRATWHEPGIHNHEPGLWIPGLRAGAHPGMTESYCVFATRGGVAVETNCVASKTPMPSGVGIIMRNGTRMRVPAIGANQASMLRWAARYLIAARSGMYPATGVKYTAHTTTGPE